MKQTHISIFTHGLFDVRFEMKPFPVGCHSSFSSVQDRPGQACEIRVGQNIKVNFISKTYFLFTNISNRKVPIFERTNWRIITKIKQNLSTAHHGHKMDAGGGTTTSESDSSFVTWLLDCVLLVSWLVNSLTFVRPFSSTDRTWCLLDG